MPGVYVRVSCHDYRDEADRVGDLLSIIHSLCVILERLSDTEKGKSQVQTSLGYRAEFLHLVNTGRVVSSSAHGLGLHPWLKDLTSESVCLPVKWE